MGWVCGTLAISFEHTFYLSLDLSFGLGKGANGDPFQRQ
jgi:hypothetical protein